MNKNNSNILVCGLGSIGARHLNNIKKVWPNAIVTVLRSDVSGPIDKALGENINSVVGSVADALNPRPLAAIIANPATLHVELGLKLAEAGVHLLVEKPMSHDVQSAELLATACEKQRLKLLVGYNLRFNPLLQKLKSITDEGVLGRIMSIRSEVGQYLPDWRPGKPYQATVSAQSRLGGGVLLELSHELDYLGWLFGKPDSIYAKIGKYSEMDLDVEDTAELVLEFRDTRDSPAVLANVHLDMVQRAPTRTCKIIGSEGTVLWDGIENTLKVYKTSSAKWEDLANDKSANRNDMYLQELQHFRDCIENNEQPFIKGTDGIQVLKVVEAAKKSAAQNAVVKF